MNWTRYKLLIISGGITLVLSGVLIFWILSTGKANAEIDQEISTLTQTQDRLTASTPYPSESNLSELIRENERVTEYRNRIMDTIREQQFEVPDIRRHEFGDYVRGQWVPELRQLARTSVKGGENGVVLQDPSFGLQEYLDGALPEMAQLPKLLLDLQAKAHLSRLLFESGISELMVIQPIEAATRPTERTRTPGTGGPPPMMGGAPRPARPGQAAAEPQETRSVAEMEAERLFEWAPFRLEFRVYEDFYWDTLNRLLADPNQIVLTRLAVTNSNQMLWPDYLRPLVTGTTRARPRETRPAPRERGGDMLALLQGLDRQTPAAESAGPSTALPGLSERRMLRVGGDLLNVVMEVKIYRLKPVTPETTQGS